MLTTLLIAIAGFTGALLRVAATNLISGFYPSTFPAATLLVNAVGCYLLALFMTLSFELFQVRIEYRAAIATGLLGAFTTFSLFTMDTFILFENAQFVSGIVYYLGTPLCCIASSFFGVNGAHFLEKKLLPQKQ